jgi:bisphosphoglycerate-independent phosphoglycerate mutase (AlkP superfamily)
VPEGSAAGAEGSAAAVPFFHVFCKVEEVMSGMHHTEGMLWIRTCERHHRVEEENVPLAFVAPTILRLFSLDPPESMRGKPLPLAS